MHRVLASGGAFAFSAHNRSWSDVGKLPWQRSPKWRSGFVRDCLTALVLLHYHIAIPDQVRQLETLGFADTVAYNMSGAAVRDDTHDSTTYFLTRKAT